MHACAVRYREKCCHCSCKMLQLQLKDVIAAAAMTLQLLPGVSKSLTQTYKLPLLRTSPYPDVLLQTFLAHGLHVTCCDRTTTCAKWREAWQSGDACLSGSGALFIESNLHIADLLKVNHLQISPQFATRKKAHSVALFDFLRHAPPIAHLLSNHSQT